MLPQLRAAALSNGCWQQLLQRWRMAAVAGLSTITDVAARSPTIFFFFCDHKKKVQCSVPLGGTPKVDVHVVVYPMLGTL